MEEVPIESEQMRGGWFHWHKESVICHKQKLMSFDDFPKKYGLYPKNNEKCTMRSIVWAREMAQLLKIRLTTENIREA